MYTIRQADISDILIITDFRTKMFLSFLEKDAYDFQKIAEFETDYFKTQMEKNQFAAWVAETEKGEAVACSAVSFYRLQPKPWHPEGKYAFISSMYTEPAHRRKGIGRRLLQAALDYAADRGIRYVTLHASAAGRSLYQSFGFKDTNEMRLELSSDL